MPDDQTKETTSPEPVVQLPEPGAETKVVDGAGTKEGQTPTPAPRVYTTEEWNKRQSAWDKQIAKSQSELDTKLAEIQRERDEALARAEEARYENFIRKIEESGGDVDVAKEIVTRQKQVAAQEKQYRAERAALEKERETLRLAGKGKTAHDLIKQYELSEEALEPLLEAENPTEMENKALKLHLAKNKEGQRPADKLDSGRGKAPVDDYSKLPPSIALGRMMEDSKHK